MLKVLFSLVDDNQQMLLLPVSSWTVKMLRTGEVEL